MARCLPAEGRCHFFEGEGNYDEGVDVKRMGTNDRDEEASPWLDVDNLRRAAATADDDDVRMGGGDTASRNRLDVVVERCQLPLSSSGEQHDWDIDDEAREYIHERVALRNLDTTAIVGCAVAQSAMT